MRPHRRPRLPHQLAENLSDGGRVLAAAPLVDGDWAVATTRALVVVGAAGATVNRAWDEIDHGGWDADGDTVTVWWVDGSDATVLALATPAARAFPETFRERVHSSVVHVERAPLRPGVTARAVIRRDADGSLYSQTSLEGRARLTPTERRAVDDLERSARQAVGLPA